MKKILASLLIALMLINVGIYVFADETKSTGTSTQSTTENVSATLKMTSEIKLDEKNKEVKVKIGYGEIKGLGEGELISYQGIITYSQEYFGELTQDDIKAESGYTAVYNPENKRLIVEATRTPKSNENTVEITFKLKENVKDVTTSIEEIDNILKSITRELTKDEKQLLEIYEKSKELPNDEHAIYYNESQKFNL